MKKPTLVIMAAGIGSRYGGLKQLDAVGPSGEIIIDYSIYDAIQAGFGKVVFVIRPDIEAAFREKIGNRIGEEIETAYVFQTLDDLPEGFSLPAGREKPWGTGQAVLICREEIDRPFAVINSDDFYGAISFAGLAEYLRKASDRDGVGDYCMMGFILKNTLSEFGTVSRGFCRVNGDGYLEDIQERLKIKKEGEKVSYTENGEDWIEEDPGSTVSMNMWGFTPGIFPELEKGFSAFLKEKIKITKSEYLLPEEVGSMIREKKATVKVIPTAEKWFGVTYPKDKPHVQAAISRLVNERVYPENLW
ncbi:MAG: sugar phosphate nucleotidyltransferase [Candidatus Auribacterota bacterium]|nr:sugar phosphate nucleotidyltransferase [Candidatus Auribacterota bacterium]